MCQYILKTNKVLILVLSPLLLTSPALADFWGDAGESLRQTGRDIDPTNKHSPAAETLRNIDISNKNSAIRDAGRKIDAYRIEGMESAVKVCETVGYTKCLDTNFLNTYAGLKTAANAGMFRGSDQCGGFVHTLVNTGKAGVQIYAAANGAAIPPQVLELGAGQARAHGNDSCEVMYGSPNPRNLVSTNINGVPITVTRNELQEFQEFESQIQEVETISNPSHNPTSNSLRGSNSDSSLSQDSASENTEENTNPTSNQFRVKW